MTEVRPARSTTDRASTGDIVLSIILPGFGLMIGCIALVKRQVRRAATMGGISAAVLSAVLVLAH